MNALVDIIARRAKDTDLCSMLNMVNGCVSREVTNKGKKQTAEYRSSFTKKAFYFFPGLNGNPIAPIDYCIHNRNDVNRVEMSTTATTNADYQHDSSAINFDEIKKVFIENLVDKWKNLARELDVNENDIERISRENISLKEKFSLILDIVAKTRENHLRQILIDMLRSLKQCRRISYYSTDQLYSEFFDIKCLYDNLRKKNIKLSDQIKSYILSKTNDFCASNISDQSLTYDDGDNEQIISLLNKQDEDFIRSDQLWGYLLNINPNSTPNFQNIICYIFSIPCSNSYVESIFSHMRHLFSDYRNKIDMKLVSAELKIRMNSNYSCERFYKHILSQTHLLKQIRKNAKYE